MWNTTEINKLILGAESAFENFDKFLATAQPKDNYPPHNVIQNKDNVILEVAVAGFKPEEVDVTTEGNVLQVKAQLRPEEIEGPNYVHKGIATRAFTKRFRMNDNLDMDAVEAKFENGLLIITIPMLKTEESVRKVKIKTA